MHFYTSKAHALVKYQMAATVRAYTVPSSGLSEDLSAKRALEMRGTTYIMGRYTLEEHHWLPVKSSRPWLSSKLNPLFKMTGPAKERHQSSVVMAVDKVARAIPAAAEDGQRGLLPQKGQHPPEDAPLNGRL